MRVKELTAYPRWSCKECGLKHGSGKMKEISTWHFGECDVCKKNQPVTEPRDFFHFINWFQNQNELPTMQSNKHGSRRLTPDKRIRRKQAKA